MWIYLVAPLIATPVILGNLFDLPAPQIARELLGSYLPFLPIPLALHPVAQHLVPRPERRVPHPAARLGAQLLVLTVVAATCAALLIKHELGLRGGPRP